MLLPSQIWKADQHLWEHEKQSLTREKDWHFGLEEQQHRLHNEDFFSMVTQQEDGANMWSWEKSGKKRSTHVHICLLAIQLTENLHCQKQTEVIS